MTHFTQWKLNRELKKHYKRELKMAQEEERNYILPIFSLLCVLTIGFFYYYGYRFSKKDIPYLFQGILIILNIILWVFNIKLKKNIEKYKRGENIREAQIIKRIEDKSSEKQQQLTHIILKNEEGYDIKTWNIGKAYSLLIGKSSRIRVDIDLTEASYGSLISKNHAILNKTDNGWFIEDLGSVNGTGIHKLKDNRKIKVKTGPVKVESGDIIYIATTALLIK